ncbi:MAG: hypothetical protein HYY50_04105 [Candidatus Kerfeldbacteria bacterium]|nr:hypothetical protein [Candidatus Kerfeldbacteria bacterium]
MPVLIDPATALPEKSRKLTPAQIITLLLYPVIFVVGLSVGLVIGLKQGQQQAEKAANESKIPSTVVPNANAVINKNTSNANLSVNGILGNGNALNSGDYLAIDSATQAELNRQEQRDKERLVDQSSSLTDIFRQQDLISLKYRLKAYYAVKRAYPSTGGKQIRLDRGTADVLYQTLKDFYGGSFNEPIDPEHPTHYYGYTSSGQNFELTSYLVSQQKVFIIKDTP